MQLLNISITPKLSQPVLYYSQGDIGREFSIKLKDFDIPSGATCQMVATKPSGLGFTVAGTVSGNKVAFTTTAVMTDEWGRFPAELRITSGNTVIGTANFYMEGERNPHPEGTTDGSQETLIPELTLLVERAENAAQTATDDAIEAASATIDEVLNYLPTEVTNLKSDLSEPYYNKFDKNTIEKGKTVLSDGTVTNGSGYNLSDYIPTSGLTTIFTEWSGSYFQFRVAVYDSSKVFQERKTSGVLTTGSGAFTLTNNGYIRVILQSASNSDGQNNLDTVLVVDGQDLKPYVPSIIAVDYKERQATEHVKNVEFFTNLLDESDTANVRTGGFFGSSGWTSNANFNTYFVPIEPYKTYQTNIPTQACAACDANKNFLSYVPTKADGTWYTSAPSARYAGIAFKADLGNRGKHMFIDGGSVPTWYIRPNTAVLYDENAKAYFENTVWRGKSWYSFGTSMEDINPGGASGNVGTSGKWPLYVDGVSGLIRNNQAVGGGGICPSTSGQGLVKTRVLACPYDVDLVTIEAGPNDWTEITLGQVGDIGDDTFLGNLRQCYEYLTEHTRARVVSICISNSNDNGGKPFYKNQFGYTYRDYMNGVRELSKYYGITNIDVAGDLLGWGRRTADLLKDHIHYTELGGAVVGEFIWNKLKLVEPFPRFSKEEASL